MCNNSADRYLVRTFREEFQYLQGVFVQWFRLFRLLKSYVLLLKESISRKAQQGADGEKRSRQ